METTWLFHHRLKTKTFKSSGSPRPSQSLVKVVQSEDRSSDSEHSGVALSVGQWAKILSGDDMDDEPLKAAENKNSPPVKRHLVVEEVERTDLIDLDEDHPLKAAEKTRAAAVFIKESQPKKRLDKMSTGITLGMLQDRRG